MEVDHLSDKARVDLVLVDQARSGDQAAEGDRRDHVHPMVESGARRHMVGPHHESDQQERGKGRARQTWFGGRSHAFIVRGRAPNLWHASD